MGLEQWDEAEEYFESNAARYGSPVFQWYFNCRFTGKMDRAKAERAVRGNLANIAPSPSPDLAFLAGRFFLMVDDLAKAERMFVAAHAAKTEYSGIFLALTRAARGDADAFRDTLREITTPATRAGSYSPVGELILEWETRFTVPGDANITARLAAFSDVQKIDADFFLGWYFHNRKEPDRARTYWDRFLKSETETRMLKTHAKVFLEAAGRK